MPTQSASDLPLFTPPLRWRTTLPRVDIFVRCCETAPMVPQANPMIMSESNRVGHHLDHGCGHLIQSFLRRHGVIEGHHVGLATELLRDEVSGPGRARDRAPAHSCKHNAHLGHRASEANRLQTATSKLQPFPRIPDCADFTTRRSSHASMESTP